MIKGPSVTVSMGALLASAAMASTGSIAAADAVRSSDVPMSVAMRIYLKA
jgi:hypothetical protein